MITRVAAEVSAWKGDGQGMIGPWKGRYRKKNLVVVVGASGRELTVIHECFGIFNVIGGDDCTQQLFVLLNFRLLVIDDGYVLKRSWYIAWHCARNSDTTHNFPSSRLLFSCTRITHLSHMSKSKTILRGWGPRNSGSFAVERLPADERRSVKVNAVPFQAQLWTESRAAGIWVSVDLAPPHLQPQIGALKVWVLARPDSIGGSSANLGWQTNRMGLITVSWAWLARVGFAFSICILTARTTEAKLRYGGPETEITQCMTQLKQYSSLR